MKKRIISLVLMLSMVVMLLPIIVFANVIESTLDISYNGPSKICLEQDFTFSYTIPDNYRSGASFVTLTAGFTQLTFSHKDVSKDGQTYTVTVTSQDLKRFFGTSSSFEIYMGADHNNGGQYGSGYIKVMVEIGHVGGTATCNAQAICEICGEAYGEVDPTNHVGDTEIRNAKAATCTENGYEGDIYCTSCNTKLSSGEPIAASGHKDTNKDHSCDVCYAKVGEHIDTNYDHKCDYDCAVPIGEHKAGEGKHTCDYCGAVMSECSGGTATCKDKAICEICGKPYGEVDLTNHVGDTEVRDAKAVTCTENGYEGDIYCKSCNTKLSSGEPIAASGHKDDNQDHSCDVCGAKVGAHIDTDYDHKCDYGCTVAIGKHEDVDHDHKCDYGCSVAIGDHKAGEGKHTCDYCGAVMSKCSGGTATCKDKAICEICGKPYGEADPTNHVGNTEIRDAKAATCTEDGYTGDIYCKGCNEKLQEGNVIEAFGHEDADKDHKCDVCEANVGEHIDVDHDHKCDYGCVEVIGEHTDMDHDHKCDYGCAEVMGEHTDMDHDHKCDYGCAEVIGEHTDMDHDHKCDYGCSVAIGDHKAGEGKHTCDYCGAVMSKCSGGTATCKDKAICEICGKPYGNVDPTNHVGDTEIRDAKAATCTEDGYEGDIYCKSCNTKLSSGEPIAASGHKDTNKDHSCDVCGAEVGEHIDADHDHKCDYGCTVAIGDHKAGEGKHTCDYCGAVMSKCSGGTATCKDKAICEICGKPYGEVDPTNHVGDTEIRDAKAATCTEDGYEGDIYCKSCNTKLSSGEPIAAFGHTYKDEVTKEATTESAGIRTYTCEKCGDSYTEEIAKLPAKTEPTKPSKPENRVEPTKPSKPETRVEPSKPTEPQKQTEPPKTANQTSLIEILIAMFVNGIAVPSMQLITSIWQLILQFIKMLLAAAF